MRFLKNIGWAASAQTAAALGAFFYTILSARFLGVGGYGLFQAAMGIYGLFSAAHLVFYFGAVHLIGRAREAERPAVTGALLSAALILSAAVLTAFMLFENAGLKILKTTSPGPWRACALLIAGNTLLTLFYGGFQAAQSFRLFAASKIAEVLLTLAAGLGLMRLGWGAAGAVYGYAMPMGLLAVFFWLRLRPPLRPSAAVRGMLFGEAASLARLMLVLFFLLALEHLPAVWGRAVLAPAESGRFAALYNLRNGVWPFALSVTLTFYSHRLAQEDPRQLLRHALFLILGLAAGFEVLALAASAPLIGFLYGPDFLPAAPYLPLYALSLGLQMLVMLFLFERTAAGTLNLLFLPAALMVFGTALFFAGHSVPGILAAQISGTLACFPALCVPGRKRRPQH